MPKIDQITIDKIKAAANVKDLLEDFGYDLRKKGTKYHCLCPFHDDHNLGSFVVNPVKGTYACYSCGARGNSIDFLMHHEHKSYIEAIRYLGKKYDIEVEGSENIVVTKAPPRPPVPPKATLILPRRLVARSRERAEDTNFVRWLRGLAWDDAQRARIDEMLRLYAVGADKDGWTIFWQVDERGQVLNGKLMKYRPDGHRDKGEDDVARGRRPYTTDWIHSRLKRKRDPQDPWPHPDIFNPDIQEEHYTFFGMHLLDRYPKAAINVVESEKTAIVCAIAYGAPDMNLWLACGGKTMLSNERMEPLFREKRQIILWPDTDGMEEWAEWIKLLNQPSITIQRDFFTRYWREELDGKKADVADILTRWMTETTQGITHQITHTGDPQPPTRVGTGGSAAATPETIPDEPPEGVLPEEWQEHKAIMRAIKEWKLEHPNDEPFHINTPLQQLLHDRVEESKRLRKLKQKEDNDRKPKDTG